MAQRRHSANNRQPIEYLNSLVNKDLKCSPEVMAISHKMDHRHQTVMMNDQKKKRQSTLTRPERDESKQE